MVTIPETLILPPCTIHRHGVADELLPQCAALGKRGVLVHGCSLARTGRLTQILHNAPADLEVQLWEHPGGEPTLGQLEALLSVARRERPDWIAAVGGGSVMDLAKACAGLIDAPHTPGEYQRGEFELQPTRTAFVAVPTTAGTGSEATMVSVLTDETAGLKRSIRHPSHMARLVLLDETLLANCPPAVVAASGMDALTQAIESYVSSKASWLTEQLSLRAVTMIAGSLEAVFDDPPGASRGGPVCPASELLLGSYLAGIAFSHARLGLVHGLAHPLGARFHAPHGLVCAICLPHVLAFNQPVLGEKYEALSHAAGADLAGEISRLTRQLRLESPFSGGSHKITDLETIVAETQASGSTAANPRVATDQEIRALIGAIVR